MLKYICKSLFYPPLLLVFLLIPFSAALLIYVFTFSGVKYEIQYLSYLVSAYTLTTSCCKLPALIQLINRIRNETPILLRYRHDARFRVSIALCAGLSFNVLYALLQFGLGLRHESIWFYSIALYYIILAIMRFFLLRSVRSQLPGENIIQELKQYRFCGSMLLLMNLSLAIIVFYITWENRTFHHHEITSIAMAAYTFTSFTLAAINVFKYKKYNSPVYSAAKATSLAAAIVSMLTLETAMLTAFGNPAQESFRRIMTGATGAVVTTTVLIMAIYMIRKASSDLGKLREET